MDNEIENTKILALEKEIVSFKQEIAALDNEIQNTKILVLEKEIISLKQEIAALNRKYNQLAQEYDSILMKNY